MECWSLPLFQQLQIAKHLGQQIVEVVSYTRGELTNHFELLRLKQRFLGALAFGNLCGQAIIGSGKATSSFRHYSFELLSSVRQGLARLDNVGDIGAGPGPPGNPAVLSDGCAAP